MMSKYPHHTGEFVNPEFASMEIIYLVLFTAMHHMGNVFVKKKNTHFFKR